MARSEYRDLDTDVTLGGSGASDIYVPSQKAVKTYIDNATNLCYSVQNPQLTPTLGYATWTVTHNLGTTNVICTVYSNGLEIARDVTITSADVVTLSIPASTTISANVLTVVIVGIGGTGTGTDSTFSKTSNNPLSNSAITNNLMFMPGDSFYLSYGPYICGGYLTTAKKEVQFCITLPKIVSPQVSSYKVTTLECLIRVSSGGYLFSGSATSWKNIATDSAYNLYYWFVNPNTLALVLQRSSGAAFDYGTNNTPVAIQIGEGFTITFS